MDEKTGSQIEDFAWITANISGSLLLLWSCMPVFDLLFSILHQLGGELNVISIDQINPWALRLTDLNIESMDVNLSLKQLDARYDPLGLVKGEGHSLSLTSPVVRIDSESLLDRLRLVESMDNEKKSFQSVAREFIQNPLLRHVRLRDASVFLANEEKALLSNLAWRRFLSGTGQSQIGWESFWLGMVG